MNRDRNVNIAGVAMTVLLAWLVVYPILIVVLDATNGAAWSDFFTRPSESAAKCGMRVPHCPP